MAERRTSAARPADPAGRVLFALARLLAILGGLVLTAMALMVLASILGRNLLRSPVAGDFELVEMGTAVAVFAFLPYCQLVKGNVIVDFFTVAAPSWLKGLLDALGGLMFLAIASVLAWRMWIGARELAAANDRTWILGIQTWVAFVPIVASLVLLTAVCLYTVIVDARSAARDEPSPLSALGDEADR